MRLKALIAVLLIVTTILVVSPKTSEERLITSVEKTINSCVYIVNETGHHQGSGVAITDDIILTAWHVAEDGGKFTITLNDGRQLKATKAISNKKYDYAFIKVDESILEPAKMGCVAECKLGQSVYMIGSPHSKINFNSVTSGIISGLNRNCDEYGEEYGWSITFASDSAAHPGSSGCPVFTLDGRVRGIVVGGHSPVLVYCIPVDLFVSDIAAIQMMFVQKDYYIEKEEYCDVISGMQQN